MDIQKIVNSLTNEEASALHYAAAFASNPNVSNLNKTIGYSKIKKLCKNNEIKPEFVDEFMRLTLIKQNLWSAELNQKSL